METGIRRYLVQPVEMTATDWLVDAVVAAGAFGFAMVQLALFVNLFVPDAFTRMILGIQSAAPTASETAAMALGCLPLLVRRRFPWPVFASTLTVWLVADLAIGFVSLPVIAVLVALFTVAYERSSGEAFIALGTTLAALVLSVALAASNNLAMLMLFQNASLAIAVTMAGYALHTRQDYLAAAEARVQEAERLRASEEERAQQAELTRETEARRRVEAERVRIAREVHDITAHSLSAVSIQAAVAERLIDVDPEEAKAAVAQVRATAKSSLEDMRSMIGVLRGDDRAETSPVEGTDRMGDLVDYLEGAGVACDLSMSAYDRARVSAPVDIALFGIAREACTNIVRHAEAAHSRIVLTTEGDAATLEVTDDGKGLPPAGACRGHGIEGMRERAHLLNGAFDLASTEGAGTSLRISIPFPPPSRRQD